MSHERDANEKHFHEGRHTMKTTTKKITLATVKAFIRKNHGGLFIRVGSHFDGMRDCVEFNQDSEFSPALPAERPLKNNLGIQGAWCVLGGRDWFAHFEADGMTGIEISNCCGTFTLAIKRSE
jgi:hypothetical protein